MDQALAAWRQHLELKRLLAEIRLDLLRLEYLRKYRQDQPRVPAGNPDGGQWTSDGGGGGRTDRSVLSDVTPDNTWKPGARYAANEAPREDRLLNKHIKDDHINKTDEEIKRRIRTQQIRGLLHATGRDRHGTFDSEESARELIRATLDNNSESVSAVASGRSREALVTWEFGRETGREAYLETPDSEVRVRKASNVGVFIVHDPGSEFGYRVISAYPRNFNPRIGR